MEMGNEWWWIDYLENEMDPGLDHDLRLLLEHSQEDRDSFENFRLLREWVRASDPVASWPVETRVTRVRANVMQAIEQIDKAEKRKSYRASLETKALSV
jgi:hypothetical protein